MIVIFKGFKGKQLLTPYHQKLKTLIYNHTYGVKQVT